MTTETVDDLRRKAETLTADEQLQLASFLVELARKAYPHATPRKWRELQGRAQYPLAGEDAQAWVSRTRREADERRRIDKDPQHEHR